MPRASTPVIRQREMTDAQYEAAVRRWNHIGKVYRAKRYEQCKQEGHNERTYGDARVCIRCLRYTYEEG